MRPVKRICSGENNPQTEHLLRNFKSANTSNKEELISVVNAFNHELFLTVNAYLAGEATAEYAENANLTPDEAFEIVKKKYELLKGEKGTELAVCGKIEFGFEFDDEEEAILKDTDKEVVMELTAKAMFITMLALVEKYNSAPIKTIEDFEIRNLKTPKAKRAKEFLIYTLSIDKDEKEVNAYFLRYVLNQKRKIITERIPRIKFDGQKEHKPVVKKPRLYDNFSLSPSSPLTQSAYKAIIAGGNSLKTLAENVEASRHGKASAEIERDGNSRTLKQVSKSSRYEFSICMEDADLFKGGHLGSAARKVFVYLLSQVVTQALDNGEITRDRIVISYQDLINKGLYASVRTANTGIERAFNQLSSLKFSGTFSTKGKNGKKIEQKELGVLFYHMTKTGKGEVVIYLNDKFNWNVLVQYYITIPDIYYSLPSNAADILYYICYLARQRREEITKTGAFTISYRAIQMYLNLPDEKAATKATTQIREPIEAAIGNILDNVPQDILTIDPGETEYTSIHNYLSNSLTVTPKGKYLKHLQEVFETAEKKISANQKRVQKIKDKALQAVEERKIEEARKSESS